MVIYIIWLPHGYITYTSKNNNFLYIIMINTDEIKCSEYSPTIDTIKNDHLRKELESIQDTIKYTRDKKIEDFVTIFRITIDHT